MELSEKVDSLLKLEEIEYIFSNPKLKEERLQKIEKTRSEIESSSLSYGMKERMLLKIYGSKFILGLRNGNDYSQLFASGGLGFLLGFLANDRLKNYFDKIAKEFVSNFMQYSKS